MLQTAAQAATVLASVAIIFAVIAYRRETRGQNLAGLFELHQYLAKDNFAEARRVQPDPAGLHPVGGVDR